MVVVDTRFRPQLEPNQHANNLSRSWSVTLRSIYLALGSLVLSTLAFTAHAEPVTFTETLTGSSLFGPAPGTNQPITITGTGNTNNVVFTSATDTFTLLLTSVTVQDGSGPVNTFTGTIEAFVADNFIAGFEQLTPQNVNIAAVTGGFFSDTMPFAGYGLNSSISVTGGTEVAASSTDFGTTGGTFDFFTFSDSATFSSTVAPTPTPEPSSFLLLGSGILGLMIVAGNKLNTRRSN
jgi:hypothetical protein